MSIALYYFSGTGNTLFVARKLQEMLPDCVLIPIVAELKSKRIRAGADAIGIISPLHGMTLPVPVTDLLRRIDMRGLRYIFAVTTRGGTVTKGFSKMRRLLARNGRILNSSFLITMAGNDPKLRVYQTPSQSAFHDIERSALEELAQVRDVVAGRQSANVQDKKGQTFPYSPLVNYLLERLVLFGMALVGLIGVNNYFYSDEKCAGCGTCEKVCLSGKIKLVEERPTWQRGIKCYFCYACLNYCPREALQIKSKWYMKSFTPIKPRYPHPYATADEIAMQKTAGMPITMV